MANKRLSPDQIQEMKDMVVRGVYPDDIAKHFDIAISSVHNYKTRFKEEGLVFPSVKGKRPSGAPSPEDINKSKKDTHVSPAPPAAKPQQTSIEGVVNSNSPFRIIINGVAVMIGEGAKSVNIGKDSLEIQF
jgi:hypothetical protein